MLAILWGEDKITRAIAVKASALTKYFVSCWCSSYISMNKTDSMKVEDKILEMLEHGRLTKSALRRHLSSKLRIYVDDAFDILLENGEIRRLIDKQDRGRPTECFELITV